MLRDSFTVLDSWLKMVYIGLVKLSDLCPGHWYDIWILNLAWHQLRQLFNLSVNCSPFLFLFGLCTV